MVTLRIAMNRMCGGTWNHLPNNSLVLQNSLFNLFTHRCDLCVTGESNFTHTHIRCSIGSSNHLTFPPFVYIVHTYTQPPSFPERSFIPEMVRNPQYRSDLYKTTNHILLLINAMAWETNFSSKQQILSFVKVC